MGCHTWFSVPYKTDKEEIIKLAQEFLNKSEYMSLGHKQMYQWAIDNKIEEPVCELASFEIDCNRQGEWSLYKDVKDFSIEKHNEKSGLSIDKYDYDACEKAGIESYSDEPRIGGYPDRIIRSYDDMIDFMSTGFTDDSGKHYDFYYDKERKEDFMSGIKQFFINHPQGIITFG